MGRLRRLAALALVFASGPAFAQVSWKEFAAAADAGTPKTGAMTLEFAWEIPKKRVLMLARDAEGQTVLYQVDRKPGLEPADARKQVNCHFQRKRLHCAGPGDASPSPVEESGTGGWAALEAHAATQIQTLDVHGLSALQAQLTASPAPKADIHRKRHPFEWGGEHETVENAQAFLEAVTAAPVPFRSGWPRAPWLGSQGNQWQNRTDRLVLRTAGRCLTVAESRARTALHFNHDFWASDTVEFQTVYHWRQPIDWSAVIEVRMEGDAVFAHGRYPGKFDGQALTYVSGWRPSIITANASRFDPSEYDMATWNLELVLPDEQGLRERVLYAMTYLEIMCGRD